MAKELNKSPNGARLTLINKTLSTLSFVKSIEWVVGNVATPGFPASIGPGVAETFSHLRTTSNAGSRAALVYSGTNAAKEPCAWILAWSAPNYSYLQDRVYVLCGPKTLIDSMTDDQILMFLNSSLDTSNATNLGTKTSANATIDDSNGNMATVGANFALIP
ncbi:hypothetical protein RND81_10G143300 [Saponaria officinalis]|uniref:Uncharacterized protein n=1 Tax=Saponaria officinalis TaxID=3572 RepID=A0AAW1I4F7_SAPOF